VNDGIIGFEWRNMAEDYLANWISEYPSLYEKVLSSPQMERYFRTTPVVLNNKKVDDQTWNMITATLSTQ
jgi:hypothetical protein